MAVTISLALDDNAFDGVAIGDGDHMPRLAGEATLRAVEKMLPDDVDLELLAVATADLGAARIAFAQVRLGPDEVLVGNALLGTNDPTLAAAKAVMNALNRRLGTLLAAAQPSPG